MSEHVPQQRARAPYPARLLYSQRGTFRAGHIAGAHAHPFWQMELFENGPTRMHAGGQTREVTGGWAVLLPPHVVHVSEYLEDGTRTTSLKFEMHAPVRSAVSWRGPSSTGSHIVNALTGLLPPTMRYATPNRPVVDALLSALAAYVADPDTSACDTRQHRPAVERARETVLSCDRWPLTIPDIASRVGLSPSRISHLFRDQYGVTLKAFIDTTRADIAARHLRYSIMPVTQVAELMGFDSLHSFSRFFRRVTGTSPRELKRAEGE